jgi:hypothetical protein
MTPRRALAFAMIAILGLGVQAKAQAPCPELVLEMAKLIPMPTLRPA